MVLMVVALVILGCVDTSEPTGPAPTPPEDGGELTSAEVMEGDLAGPTEGARTRMRSDASR
jgi:hypothetical protein